MKYESLSTASVKSAKCCKHVGLENNILKSRRPLFMALNTPFFLGVLLVLHYIPIKGSRYVFQWLFILLKIAMDLGLLR